MKTSELTGDALDWAIAEAQGIKVYRSKSGKWMTANYDEFNHRHGAPWYRPSTDWEQGGTIIEREMIELVPQTPNLWDAMYMGQHIPYEGSTPLIAAMRCFVASRMGDDIELPEELT